MSATYDPALPTNMDWVRYLVGDTVVSGTSARLQDEEILALIAEEVADTGSGAWTKYFAAARALEGLYSRWTAAGKGILDEQVSKLRIRRAGGDQSAAQAVRDRSCYLRERGAELILDKPRVFSLL